ncbi:Dihydrodipicolinate synthase [Microbotryomycetes sp. JL201]|nr:Dihydrodipicolinate synthase [Microbotryomycetes sp. JL201]
MSALDLDSAHAASGVLHTLHLDNPLNTALVIVCIVLAARLLPSSFTTRTLSPVPQVPLPTSPDKDYNWRPSRHSTLDASEWKQYTPQDLRAYDGTNSQLENGRILFAIRRKVYDVSSGRGFYGPGGPYAIFAGRDASRGMAKQSFEPEMLTPVDEPIDELKDLSQSEWDNLRDWESHFNNKYIQCGDLVEAKS